MGACATKSGDLKKEVKGEPPLVVEDGMAPPVAEGEKADKADGVPVAAETDPADVSRRRSLSDLLKEDAEASDGEAAGQEASDGEAAGQEAEKVVTVDSAVATDEAGAPASLSKEDEVDKAPQQVAVEPSAAVEQGTVEQDTAEHLTDDPKTCQEPGGDAQAAEEEKRVDPDSVQVAAAAVAGPSAEGSEVAGGASA